MEFENVTQLKRAARSAKRYRITRIRVGRLSSLPKEIKLFTNLRELAAEFNYFEKLPPEIGELQYLEYLSLSRSRVSELPPEIGKLQNLGRLILSYNQLTRLPKEIANLKKLNWLDVSNNKLTELPEEIGSMTNLEELYLNGNPLSTLPISVVRLPLIREPIIKIGTKPLYDLKKIAKSTTEELLPYLLSEVDIIRNLAKQRLAELQEGGNTATAVVNIKEQHSLCNA